MISSFKSSTICSMISIFLTNLAVLGVGLEGNPRASGLIQCHTYDSMSLVHGQSVGQGLAASVQISPQINAALVKT